MGHPVPPETYFVLVKISDQLDYLIQLLEQRLP
jgi:hypothetical protein